MIEVTRGDGVWFRVEYPYNVTTNGNERDQLMCKLWMEDYRMDLEDEDTKHHWTDGHERVMAKRISDYEDGLINDKQATTFPLKNRVF